MSITKRRVEELYVKLCTVLSQKSDNVMTEIWQKTCSDIMRDEYANLLEAMHANKKMCIRLSNCIGASQVELDRKIRDFNCKCIKWIECCEKMQQLTANKVMGKLNTPLIKINQASTPSAKKQKNSNADAIKIDDTDSIQAKNQTHTNNNISEMVSPVLHCAHISPRLKPECIETPHLDTLQTTKKEDYQSLETTTHEKSTLNRSPSQSILEYIKSISPKSEPNPTPLNLAKINKI
jgi:hypothetical protein